MKRILYLHSGHHGPGTGTHGFIDEGTETIRLCDEIEHYLTCKYVRSNAKEKLTNDLIKRINKQFGDKALICDIHFNAFDGSAEGCEVFVSAKASSLSHCVADDMLYKVHAIMQNSCRGVKPDNHSQYNKLAILSDTESPAILVEPCFVDNKKDTEKYVRNFTTLAMGIADVLNRYCNEEK